MDTAKFKIGDKVQFGREVWTVMKYHKIGDHWEVMFVDNENHHHSIPCSQLERYVQ